MSVTQFRSSPDTPRYTSGWSNQEIAEFYRIADIMRQAGLTVEAESGASDEGEPWFVFVRVETGDVIAHFARIDGLFIAASSLTQDVFKGVDVRHVVDQMLKRHPLMIPRETSGSRLLLHPSVVLTAFVAAAFVIASDEAQAQTLDDVLLTTFTRADAADHPAALPTAAPGAPSDPRDKSLDERKAPASPSAFNAGHEKSTGHQLALISALIMACDLASRDAAGTLGDTVVAGDAGDLLNVVTVTLRPVPTVVENEWTWDFGGARDQGSDHTELHNTFVTAIVVNTAADAGESQDTGAGAEAASPTASKSGHIIHLLESVSSRQDGSSLSIGEDLLLGGALHDQLIQPQHSSQRLDAPHPAIQLVSAGGPDTAASSIILIDLLELIGAAQTPQPRGLDAFITRFDTLRDDGSLDAILTQHLSSLAADQEARFAAELTSSGSSGASAAAAAPTQRGATPPSSSTLPDETDAPAGQTASPVPAPAAVTAIGHLLEKGAQKTLVLSDAIDVLLYEGGDVDVHNFELGKDRLWFYVDEAELASAKYHLASDGDLVMEFSSGSTLTLFDVIKPDASYEFL